MGFDPSLDGLDRDGAGMIEAVKGIPSLEHQRMRLSGRGYVSLRGFGDRFFKAFALFFLKVEEVELVLRKDA